MRSMTKLLDTERFWHSSPRISKNVGKLLLVLGVVTLVGCHQDMYDQPKYRPLQKSTFYPDGLASRPLIEGTVPRGHARVDEHLYTGRVNGRFVETFPFVITDSVLNRGENRYATFCSPCHGGLGDGNGMIVKRGFPQPNSFHADSVRIRPVGHYFDVMTNGFGRMYSYASSVPVHDRWAIAAYIRALQLSQRVSLGELLESERKLLTTR